MTKGLSKYSLLIASAVILVVVPSTMGQRAEQTDDQTSTVIKTPNKQVKARVVAIRRVNLLLRDPEPKGITDEDRRPYVEIELYVGSPDPGANLAHLIQIGDIEYAVHSFRRSGEVHHVVLLLEAQDFDDLADAVEIFYRVGEPISREKFKKLYDEGKFTGDHGLNAGRLDKKMVDLEPTIERRAGWTPPQ